MSAETALLHAITAHRGDDTARLVYADWLDEHDQPDRAAYLRAQIELARRWWYDKPCPELYARLAVLAVRIDAEWLATVRRCTTPAPPLSVEDVFPELRGTGKVTVRLHPRAGHAPTDASKIGGMFLWPKKEPWPVCPEHEVPYVPALQLRKEDVPELGFPDGTDLFQLLWCPKEHDDENRWCPRPGIFWRKRSAVTDARKWPPKWKQRRELYDEEEDMLPAPCRIHPERVTEYPHHDPFGLPYDEQSLPPALRDVVAMVRKLPPVGTLRSPSTGPDLLYSWLGQAVGVRVGGYPYWNHRENFPRCACGSDMEYLLAFASREFDGASWGRWVPIEDRPAALAPELSGWAPVCEPLGVMFGRCMTMNVFICRKHDPWPVRASID
jgi:uncharacterized protein (TIGR02996 family)